MIKDSKASSDLNTKPCNADPSGPDLGFPDDGAGLDLCGLHHGHGGLEDHLHWGHGRVFYNQGGLVLVQPVEILFYRLDCCQQLLRLPCALVCGGYVASSSACLKKNKKSRLLSLILVCILLRNSRSHPDSARPADGRSHAGYAGLRAQSAGHGVHLPRRKRSVQVQEDLRWRIVPHNQR